MERIKVLYLGGFSRSGSTLLARLLDRMDGVVTVGELGDVWNVSFRQNRLCGCGAPFRSCGFWTRVVRAGFGCDPADLPTARIEALRNEVMRYRRLPALGVPSLRSDAYRDRLTEYRDVLRRLYLGIHRASGSAVIVDSSKLPQVAWALSEVDPLEVHVIHLVRDSRATAYSWRRHKVQPEVHWRVQYMDRHNVARSAAGWNLLNAVFEWRRDRFASYTLVRYEDLATDPWRELRRVGLAAGTDWSCGAPAAGPETVVDLGDTHMACGNPNRFAVGPVAVRPDLEWRTGLTRLQRGLVTTVTLPLLARYGYPLGVRSAAEGERAGVPVQQPVRTATVGERGTGAADPPAASVEVGQ